MRFFARAVAHRLRFGCEMTRKPGLPAGDNPENIYDHEIEAEAETARISSQRASSSSDPRALPLRNGGHARWAPDLDGVGSRKAMGPGERARGAATPEPVGVRSAAAARAAALAGCGAVDALRAVPAALSGLRSGMAGVVGSAAAGAVQQGASPVAGAEEAALLAGRADHTELPGGPACGGLVPAVAVAHRVATAGAFLEADIRAAGAGAERERDQHDRVPHFHPSVSAGSYPLIPRCARG